MSANNIFEELSNDVLQKVLKIIEKGGESWTHNNYLETAL